MTEPFSFVSYKHDIKLSDVIWCENWIENHLKQLAGKTSEPIWKEARHGVERRHFAFEYHRHLYMLERLQKGL